MAIGLAIKAAAKAAAKKAVQTVTTKAGAKAAAKSVASYISNSVKDKVASKVGASNAKSAVGNASSFVNSVGSGVIGRFFGTAPSDGSSANTGASDAQIQSMSHNATFGETPLLASTNTGQADTGAIQMDDAGNAVDPRASATLDALAANTAVAPQEQSGMSKAGDIMGSIIKGAIVAKKPAMGKAFEFYESRQNKRAVDEMKDKFALQVQTDSPDDKSGELIANAIQSIKAKDTNEFATTANAIKTYFTDKAVEAQKIEMAKLAPKVVAAEAERTTALELAKNDPRVVQAELAKKRGEEEMKLDFPNLNEKQQSAMSAYKFITPRVDKLKTLIDEGLFKDAKLVKQITLDKSGDLVVPDGSPLEEAIGNINDIKLTGFDIAGAAFTGTEKEVAFNLLSPVGKSDKRWKRDLTSFQDLFGTRVESGVEGLKGARKIAEDRNKTGSLLFEGDKEERYQAWKKAQAKK